MNQVFRILRKDAKLLWIEIALSLTVLLGYTVLEPRLWKSPASMILGPEASISMLCGFLLWVLWGVLVVRLVQLERLAGLNQFWTTRPYEWWQLLTAKAAFLQIFVVLPLGLSQLVLLHAGGFSISGNAAPLLLKSLQFEAWFLLPVAFLAAITVSFAQAVLVLLGVLVAVAGSTALLPSDKMLPDVALPFAGAICSVLLAIALLVQYSRRRSLLAAGFAVAGLMLSLVLMAVMSGSPLAVASFDTSGKDLGLTVRFDSNPDRRDTLGFKNDSSSLVRVRLPQLQTTQPGIGYVLLGQQYRFTNAKGFTWQSRWLARSAMFHGEEGQAGKPIKFVEELALPRKVYEQLGDGPVIVRVDVAMREIRYGSLSPVKISRSLEEVPGAGKCAAVEDFTGIYCLAAFQSQQSVSVRVIHGNEFSETDYQNGGVGGVGFGPSPIRHTFVPTNGLESGLVEFRVLQPLRGVVVHVPEATIALKDYAHTE